MSDRVAEKIGVPAVILIAAVTVMAYALWGSMLLRSQQQAAAADPAASLASL